MQHLNAGLPNGAGVFFGARLHLGFRRFMASCMQEKAMNTIRRGVTSALVLLSAVALGGCMYDGYGRAGVSVGHGGYYDRYGYDYPRYGYGWYDGYYYPGNGYYVFDRAGKRHRWNARQRDYWMERQRDRYAGHRDRHDGKWDRSDRQKWRDRDRDRRMNADRGRESPRMTRPDRDRGDWRDRRDRRGNSRERSN